MSDAGPAGPAPPAPPAAPADDGEPTLEGCFAEDGTDLTLIAWALEMTPTERLERLQGMVNFIALVHRVDED